VYLLQEPVLCCYLHRALVLLVWQGQESLEDCCQPPAESLPVGSWARCSLQGLAMATHSALCLGLQRVLPVLVTVLLPEPVV
jgi:hypothetical protein